MKVVVLGASGLTGKQLLIQLQAQTSVNRIVVPVRQALGMAGETIEERLFDFNDAAGYTSLFPAGAVFCALGTTIKKAGSQELFSKVDFEYPLLAAKAACMSGVPHFLLVSALGANPGSKVFYNKVKGELEQELMKLPFRSITIVRPSLLLGDRAEFRLGERLMQPFAPIIPRAYKPVHVSLVAKALVHAFCNPVNGVTIIESAALHDQKE